MCLIVKSSEVWPAHNAAGQRHHPLPVNQLNGSRPPVPRASSVITSAGPRTDNSDMNVCRNSRGTRPWPSRLGNHPEPLGSVGSRSGEDVGSWAAPSPAARGRWDQAALGRGRSVGRVRGPGHRTCGQDRERPEHQRVVPAQLEGPGQCRRQRSPVKLTSTECGRSRYCMIADSPARVPDYTSRSWGRASPSGSPRRSRSLGSGQASSRARAVMVSPWLSANSKARVIKTGTSPG